MVTREGRAPVLQHPLEPTVGKVRLHLVLRQAGEAEARQGRVQPQGHVVEHQLSVDAHLEPRPACSNSHT